MRIRWANAAAADMQSISDYLKANHPHYRQPTMRKLYERICDLKKGPYIGGPGIEGGTRELLFPPTNSGPIWRALPQHESIEQQFEGLVALGPILRAHAE
jgi:plasmid stabilization system protein ParE